MREAVGNVKLNSRLHTRPIAGPFSGASPTWSAALRSQRWEGQPFTTWHCPSG